VEEIVGVTVGLVLIVGSTVGLTLGSMEGCSLGAEVGNNDGCSVAAEGVTIVRPSSNENYE